MIMVTFLLLNLAIMRTSYLLFTGSADPYVRGFSAGFMSGHLGLMIHGMTISNFYTILSMETFWFITALIMLFYYTHINQELDVEDPDESSAAIDETLEPEPERS